MKQEQMNPLVHLTAAWRAFAVPRFRKAITRGALDKALLPFLRFRGISQQLPLLIMSRSIARTTVLCGVVLAFAFATQAQATLSNDDVITLCKSSLGASVIVTKINATPGKYDTSTPALLKLSDAECPDAVVAAMIAKDASQRSQANTVAEHGTIADLAGKKTFFVAADKQKFIKTITDELNRNGFSPVDKIENADFVLTYRQWDEGSGWGAVTKGQLNVAMPSAAAGLDRVRNVWSVQKTRQFSMSAEPVGPAIKQFISDLRDAKVIH